MKIWCSLNRNPANKCRENASVSINPFPLRGTGKCEGSVIISDTFLALRILLWQDSIMPVVE